MEQVNEYTLDDLSYGLSSVFLNEENERCEFGLEEVDRLNDICLKIVKLLDKEDITFLGKLHPETFVKSIKEKRQVDKLMEKLYAQSDNKDN